MTPPLPTGLAARGTDAEDGLASGGRVDERAERIVLDGLLNAGFEKLFGELGSLALRVLKDRAQLIEGSREVYGR